MSKTQNKINAEKAYQEKQENIAELIERIQRKLKEDVKRDINWASVGSLGYVEEQLGNITEFLG